MKDATLKAAISALAIAAGAVGAQAEQWPNLPVGVKNGVAGQNGVQVFVGLGSAGDALYILDTSAPEADWKALAAFPGPVPSGAASVVAGGKFYVFSGSGKAIADDVSPIIFTDVYVYDPAGDIWSRLDTKTPVGLLGASAYAIDEDRIAIFGGYNKELFDKYLLDVSTTDQKAEPEKWQDIVNAYMGMEPEGYRWNDEVLVYTISTNSWSSLGYNPYLPNCGAALVAEDDGLMLINGEIKPGLRTPQIKQVTFDGDALSWTQLAPVPARPGEDLQEGLAGAYAGYSDGVLLVAGGANFPGARANAFAGKWFAHEGLPKTYNADIYAR